jgi:hypothetical protein
MDNRVFFKLNQMLARDDYRDLVFFFLSKKESYEYQIIHDEYNIEANTLSLNFVKGSTKQEILKRKTFTFKNYTIEAFEPNETECKFVMYENMLLTENIDFNHNQDELNLYLNLIFQNKMKPITKKLQSVIDDNLLLFQFQDDFNFDEIKKNLIHYPTLNNKFVKIHQAFETYSIIANLKDSKNFNENYFNQNFKEPKFMYWQLPFNMHNSPFVIVKFLNFDYKFNFLLKYSKIEDKEYLIENIFNYELVNQILNKLASQSIKSKSEKNESKNVTRKITNCNQCPYKPETWLKMIEHMNGHLPKDNAFKCKHCEFYSISKYQNQVHEKLHNKVSIKIKK